MICDSCTDKNCTLLESPGDRCAHYKPKWRVDWASLVIWGGAAVWTAVTWTAVAYFAVGLVK
jgi:hypothetical protein